MNNKLSKLGYTKLWLTLGVLTEEQLNEQLQVFAKSDDIHTGHYRYQTFRNYLQTRQKLTDTELDNYILLVKSERDVDMAGSAMADILNEIELSDQQLKYVTSTLKEFGFGESSLKAIRRHGE